MIIQMVNVDRIYKKQNVVALKNINLAIDKGEFVFDGANSG